MEIDDNPNEKENIDEMFVNKMDNDNEYTIIFNENTKENMEQLREIVDRAQLLSNTLNESPAIWYTNNKYFILCFFFLLYKFVCKQGNITIGKIAFFF